MRGFRRIDGVFDHAERRRRLSDVMREEGVDVLFLGLSSDLEYLSGVERGIPFFGQSSYPHGWVAGAFFRPDAEPVFVLPRMVVVFDLPVRPEGEIVVVDETDDGRAIFERVAKGLGAAASVAVGDRVWAETTIELGRIFGLERLRTGAALVNRLRRVKTDAELDTMARACRTVEAAMAAVTPRVQPGVTMAELREEVEAELRAAGSLTPSFATHIFTGMDADSLDTGTATARTPLADGTAVLFDFGGVVDGYCSDFGRTVVAGEPPVRLPRGARGDARRVRGRARRMPPRRARARGERRLPCADRGGGPGRALPPPHGARHRARRARAAVPLTGGRDASRGGYDLHRRALDRRARLVRDADRERRRLCRRGRPVLNDYPNELATNP